MITDILHPRKVPFHYTSPPVCDFIFSASGETEVFLSDRDEQDAVTGLRFDGTKLRWDAYDGALCYTVYKQVEGSEDYEIVAECSPDTFLEISTSGTYTVTAISDDGESPFPEEPLEVELS